jgi:hypothetical protein
MASPPIPPLLDYLANRSFAFYPPILHIPHNEWLFRKATWSEILVANRRSGEEIWISRRYVGEVSHFDYPLLVVGLLRELEWRDGIVVPFERRVIEMPAPVGASAEASTRNARAPVVGIRLERRKYRAFKLVLVLVAALVGLYVAVIVLVRALEVRQKKSVAHPLRERIEVDALPLANWRPRILQPARYERAPLHFGTGRHWTGA